MRIRHLLENDDEFFWESMQDHGWKPRGARLVSMRNRRISVDRDRWMYYRGCYTGTNYADANYAELLRFERDPEVQAMRCSQNRKLLKFACEEVQLTAVRQNIEAFRFIKRFSKADGRIRL